MIFLIQRTRMKPLNLRRNDKPAHSIRGPCKVSHFQIKQGIKVIKNAQPCKLKVLLYTSRYVSNLIN